MTERDRKTKEYRNMPMWKLTYKMADKNKRIINLIKSGDISAKSILKKVKYRRNLLYEVFLEKLLLWKQGKYEDKLPTFADLNKIKESK